MNVEPIGERVLVKLVEEESRTPSGIILPDTAKEKPQQGIVVAVGESEYDEGPAVEVGDKVLFAKYGGTEIEIEDEAHLILDMADILARIKD
ncbi:MAG: co-chaperone GroES [Chloroflexota bacterium]|nr:co-chaperone GroES [Chloroflexota bacterium]